MKKSNIGSRSTQALGSFSRALGASADLRPWRSRSPRRQHPVVPKQPSLIPQCVKVTLVGTGVVGHVGADVFADRSVCKGKFPGEPQPVLAETTRFV